jgi:hypothetical protein
MGRKCTVLAQPRTVLPSHALSHSVTELTVHAVTQIVLIHGFGSPFELPLSRGEIHGERGSEVCASDPYARAYQMFLRHGHTITHATEHRYYVTSARLLKLSSHVAPL